MGRARDLASSLNAGAVFNEASADVDFRVESNGEENMLLVDGGNDAVILGHSAKVDGINDDNEGVKGSGGHLQLHGATPCLDFFSYSTTNGTHGGINFMKSRNNTVGTNTVITTGDVIGSIQFGGFDGADYASIMGKIDFQAGGSGMAENDTAGEMVFYTTEDGSGGSGSSERMRISDDGRVGIGGNLTSTHFFVTHDETGEQTGVFKNSNGSVATEVVNIFTVRAADSNFSFMKMHSNNNSDVEFNFRGDGEGFADGGTFGNPADYAEFFEWKDGNTSDEDRVGYSVILDGNKIVKATSSDDTSKIIGVISGNPVIVGDCAWNRWESKFVKDDYNRYVREEYTVTEWKDSKGESISYMTDEIPSDVTVPSDAKVISTEVDGVTKLTRRKVNSSWDKSKTYIPREDRKEWDMVGMVGKLYLRKGQPTGDRWIKMKDISDTVEEWLVR